MSAFKYPTPDIHGGYSSPLHAAKLSSAISKDAQEVN